MKSRLALVLLLILSMVALDGCARRSRTVRHTSVPTIPKAATMNMGDALAVGRVILSINELVIYHCLVNMEVQDRAGSVRNVVARTDNEGFFLIEGVPRGGIFRVKSVEAFNVKALKFSSRHVTWRPKTDPYLFEDDMSRGVVQGAASFPAQFPTDADVVALPNYLVGNAGYTFNSMHYLTSAKELEMAANNQTFKVSGYSVLNSPEARLNLVNGPKKWVRLGVPAIEILARSTYSRHHARIRPHAGAMGDALYWQAASSLLNLDRDRAFKSQALGDLAGGSASLKAIVNGYLLELNQSPAMAPAGNRHLAKQLVEQAGKLKYSEKEKKIELLTQAAAADPNYAPAYYQRALVQNQLKRHDLAMNDLNRTLDMFPKYLNALRERARAHQRRDDYQAALADWSKALEIYPMASYDYVNRGRAYAKLERYDAAVADFSRAHAMTPENATGLSDRVNIYKKQKKFHEFKADLQALMDIKPDDAQIMNRMAWLLATCPEPELLNPEQALSFALMACKLSQWEKPHIIDTLAASYAASGQFEKAVEMQQKAIVKLEAANVDTTSYKKRLELYKDNKPFVEY